MNGADVADVTGETWPRNMIAYRAVYTEKEIGEVTFEQIASWKEHGVDPETVLMACFGRYDIPQATWQTVIELCVAELRHHNGRRA